MLSGAEVFGNAAYGQGSGLILEEVDCQGTEMSLSECILTDYNDKYVTCSHNEDAGVRCGMSI